MYRFVFLLFATSVSINIFFFHQNKSRNIGQQPLWEPFELNTNLSLTSLVENGYRFAGMPCGQVQFLKSIGDTTIQYEVGIDCRSYSPFSLWLEENFDIGYRFSGKTISEGHPYYPYDKDYVQNCYQGIYWRYYKFKLSQPDREEISNFIESKNCEILKYTEKWKPDGSASMMVLNRSNNLYFDCDISDRNYYQRDSLEADWEFTIAARMPLLDSKRMEAEKKRKIREERYYEWKALTRDLTN